MPGRALVEELVDEIMRLRGRILSQARDFNEKRGLAGLSQGLILSSVVHAVEAPTVAKIARSLGLTRQSVQRTANELKEMSFLEFEQNPHHKRAYVLVATPAGIKAHARFSEGRKTWLDQVSVQIGTQDIQKAVSTLRRMRRFLEHPDTALEAVAKPNRKKDPGRDLRT